jgi:hypothetical protein
LTELLNISRFSVINNNVIDGYAEDMVLQKVIYYVSLFSEEVRDKVKENRSKDLLSQALEEGIINA